MTREQAEDLIDALMALPARDRGEGGVSIPGDWQDLAYWKVVRENERLREALIWCSGSDDFAPGGKAREGWVKLCQPLLEQTGTEPVQRPEIDPVSR